MASTRFLTALEHQPIPVTAEGSGWSLTPAEADRLAQIGEQRPGFCEVGHRQVKLAQFCGVVGLGERVLEILPKTQDGASSADDCRGVLLRLLRLTERFPQFQHQAVGQHLRRAPLLEAFIAAFFEAVSVLTRGGLLKQYLEHEDDLTVVRGRIAVARQLGVHANRPDLVACAFDELTIDNVWNRVLKKAIRCARPWIRSVELNRQWVELMGVMHDVDDTRLSGPDVERLAFNRQAERYRVAIDWARWILALLAPALRAGRTDAPALLFNMNRLFESAVATVARRRVYAESGLTVETQDASRALVTMVSQDRVEPGFQLRPDLVFRREDAVVAIADTKWKLIGWDNKRRLMPSEADMYQMHAYASAFQCRELALIYPWRSELAQATGAEFRLPQVNGHAPVVTVLCLDVHDDALPLRVGRWPGSSAYARG
ncbi:McrC family protein [Rhizobacter sp. LjRoot28]|uniref:McrC family protein n=1 Tax=Rhizobacter sp. LjRoot28 TaxID=3342309 RepID=UPI003ECE8121